MQPSLQRRWAVSERPGRFRASAKHPWCYGDHVCKDTLTAAGYEVEMFTAAAESKLTRIRAIANAGGTMADVLAVLGD